MIGALSPSGSVIVAIDFGTTFSGHAYIHKAQPDTVFKVYDWPSTANGGSTPYCKTPTSLFYARDPANPDKFVLKDWGWPALVAYTQAARSVRRAIPPVDSASGHLHSVLTDAGYFATQFKLALFRDEDCNALNHSLPGDLTVERLIVDYLRSLSDYVVGDLQVKYGKHFSKTCVEWCLTVPAIWDERAKQMMKNYAQKAGLVRGPYCPASDRDTASPYALGIILEPEAASVYCQQHAKKVNINLRQGDKLMVADVGGGTVDLVVHAKTDDDPESMKVDEVVSGYGCLGGGTFVDTAFFRLLSEKIGCFESYCEAKPLIRLNISKWWQSVKTGFDGRGHTAYLDISRGLAIAWMEHDKGMGVSRYEDEYEQLRLRDTDLMKVFDDEVEKVLEQVRQEISGVKVLMVVGGFSGSRYLRQRILQAFRDKVDHIITPDDPGSAICHGAALLHLQEGTLMISPLNSRIARRTYGFGISRPWKEGDPLKHKWVNQDGKIECHAVFSPFVRIGDRVRIGESISERYCPMYKKQKAMRIRLFSSTQAAPKYTTDDGCKLEGSFMVDMSDGLDLGLQQREVVVTMCFGGSSIQVTARKNFGNLSTVESNVTFVAE